MLDHGVAATPSHIGFDKLSLKNSLKLTEQQILLHTLLVQSFAYIFNDINTVRG